MKNIAQYLSICSLTVVLSFSTSFAQWPECDSVFVPVNAQVILTNNSQIEGIRGKFWVCSDLNVTIKGDTNVVYVEKNCTVSLEGDSNIVYVRKGGVINILGEYNLVIRDTTVQANMMASWGGIVPCYDLNYYYQNAPTNGCDVFSGLNSYSNSIDFHIKIRPNPFTDQMIIHNEFNRNLDKVFLLNINGNIIFSQQLSTDQEYINLNLKQLPPSLYLLTIHTQEGQVFQEKIIKN